MPRLPSSVIRLVIVCEIRLFREGLSLLLSRHEDIWVVGEVADAAQASAAVANLHPDAVLLDGALPEGVEDVRLILEAAPSARIVVLGASEHEPDVIRYAEAGVSGYVTRDADAYFLCDTIRAVARGETLCSPQVTATLLRRVAALASERAVPQSTRLTFRESEVVELIGRGCSNKEIARQLYIETATVKNHVHRILGKLEVQRRGDIAAALRNAQGR